ncbi:uncharacterized protein LOC144704843 [Wolffia australiana]
MGSYFGEFSRALQGDLRANPAVQQPRAGSSSDDHVRSVFKHPMLHELVGTALFSSGDLGDGDGAAVAAAVAQARSQISSPRDAGVKKRKNQTKKMVVCLPAADAGSAKPGTDGVPPDSWSWRKYGQKPIKGTPYPRGYYRCSSSKGCSARKQVERSKTDPNMMVVTYTSEHNHPLPTQKTNSTPSKGPSQGPASAPVAKSEPSIATEALHRSSHVAPPDLDWSEDFFAELGELEDDNMKLVFSKELEEKVLDGADDDLDIFKRFDWNRHSFGENK